MPAFRGATGVRLTTAINFGPMPAVHFMDLDYKVLAFDVRILQGYLSPLDFHDNRLLP
jgi:hypothetical protein